MDSDQWQLVVIDVWHFLGVIRLQDGSVRLSQPGPDGLWLDSHISLGSCEPQSQEWKHIVRVSPRLPHISFSISRRFCAGCQNIQCKWCCFFLSFAPNVSTRNSLAAFRQIWQRSGVPALPLNYEQRTWYLGAVWLSKWAVPRIPSDTFFLN